MSVLNREVRTLVWKELRQIRRSRGAIASSTLLPLLTLVIVPLTQLAGFRSVAPDQLSAANPSNQFMIERFGSPMAMYTTLLLPLFCALTGVLVPSLMTAYSVVSERERHSLDLVMALPVSVADVLVAKVLSVLACAVAIVLPLFSIDAAVLLALGVLTPTRLLLLLLVLVGAFICSIGVTFVITILARDYRTANNLSGLQVMPVILFTPALMLLLPPPFSFLALAGALALVGVLALLVAWRWITFERYLA